MTPEQLERHLNVLFDQYDGLFFNGELPVMHVEVRMRSLSNPAWIACFQAHRATGSARILFNWWKVSDAPDSQIREFLLHEMVHAWLWAQKLPSGHTPAFRRKLALVLGQEFQEVKMGRSVRVPQEVRGLRPRQMLLDGL